MTERVEFYWYAEYLQSEHWITLRDSKLKEANYQCERLNCFTSAKRGPNGERLGLHVHHLTYERCPGHELLEDLQVLCIVCHQVEHGLVDDTAEVREMVARRVSIRASDIVMEQLVHDAVAEDEAWL